MGCKGKDLYYRQSTKTDTVNKNKERLEDSIMQWAGVSIGPGGGSGGGKGGRVVSKGEGFWAAIRITEDRKFAVHINEMSYSLGSW